MIQFSAAMRLLVWTCLCVFMFCGSGLAEEVPVLADSDCIKCHRQQPATVESKGAKHKTDVGCIDCHIEHGPLGKEIIPKCDMCHSGTPHYEIENCGSCHTDPHAPLEISLESATNTDCLSCHPQQGQELSTFPSAHTEQECTFCHPDIHKKFLECGECHDPHTPDMTYQDCLPCHPPHKPLEITYGPDTPSETCAACHKQAYDLLMANATKHHDLACAFCHKERHRNMPPCQACHGEPHSPELHKRFARCGECHGIAHDLVK